MEASQWVVIYLFIFTPSPILQAFGTRKHWLALPLAPFMAFSLSLWGSFILSLVGMQLRPKWHGEKCNVTAATAMAGGRRLVFMVVAYMLQRFGNCFNIKAGNVLIQLQCLHLLNNPLQPSVTETRTFTDLNSHISQVNTLCQHEYLTSLDQWLINLILFYISGMHLIDMHLSLISSFRKIHLE